jgi:parvulin-like peptidyl-prolyl isomerase
MIINDRVVPHYMFHREFQRLSQLQANQPEQMKIPMEELKTITERNVTDQFLFLLKAEEEIPQVNINEVDKALENILKQFPDDQPPSEEQKAMIHSDVEGQMRQEMYFNRLFKDISITEEEAKKEFDSNPERYAVPEQVHCSHIVRHTHGEGVNPDESLKMIMEAQKDLTKGVSFDEVVKKYSDCNGQGGDLGTFPRGQMVEKFDNVIFNMKPGELSEVFQTEFGYHIALLHEKIPAVPLEFDKIKDDLIKSMENQERDRRVQEVLSELKKKAVIVNDEPPVEEKKD